jgi:hypothetical protein
MVTRPRNLQQADPYFDSVVLLCPFSGEDGDTTSTDLSNSAHTLTFNGTAALDSDIRKYGFTSLSLDGNSDYVDIPDSDDFALGSGDFTIEFHILLSEISRTHHVINKYRNTTNDREWAVAIDADNRCRFGWTTDGINTQNQYVTGMPTLAVDTWYHYAVTRSGNTLRQFWDGVELGESVGESDSISGDTIFNGDEPLRIGTIYSNGFVLYTYGYIENVRITKGVALYTSTFTPPERAHPTVQNVDGIFELPDTSTITYDSISSSLSAAGFIVDFVWNDDGTQYIFTSDGNGGSATGWINYASCSTPYDVTTLSTTETVIDTTTGRGRGIQWNNDGTKVYTTDFSANPNFHEWDVSPAYDITSISLTPDAQELISPPGNSLLGFHFTSDGKYVIFGANSSTLYLHQLSTAWDISTIDSGTSANFNASGVTRCDQAIISNSGTRIWQLGLNTEKIHQWTLSTPFDLSTASWDGAGKDFALQDAGSYVNPTGMTLVESRNELYVTWTLTSYRIQKYTIG